MNDDKFIQEPTDFPLDETGLDVIQKSLEEIHKLQRNDDSTLENEEQNLEQDPQFSSENEESSLETVEIKPEEKEDKLWKTKRRYYKAMAERDHALEENARLKEINKTLLDIGDFNYEKLAHAELAKAKEYKKKCIEEGDVDAAVEADVALNRAVHKVEELEKYKAENTISPIPHSQVTPSYDTYKEIAHDWLENHSYLNAGSRDYDPNLANEVARFVNVLDQNLINSGQQTAYYSPEYFNTIDQYINNLRGQLKVKANIGNNSAVMPVGGVRNSYSASNANRNNSSKISLTEEERIMARNAGVLEKEWLQYKIEDLKNSSINHRR